MKNLGLDIGDVWVGSALSDPIGVTCKPYKTVKLDQLKDFLRDELRLVAKVVVGHPVTVGGGAASDQTKVIEKIFVELKNEFSIIEGRAVEWVLWDERFSTKRAKGVLSSARGKKQEKDNSVKEHSIAAAFILQSYLDYCAFHKE